MLIWDKTIPKYLVQKDAITATTIFTGIFALAFINIYSPFGVEKWYQPQNKFEIFFYSSLVILTGMAFIVLDRIAMFQVSKKHSLNYFHYSIWIFFEILSLSAVYSVFAKFVLADQRVFYQIAEVTLKNTVLVLLLPYTVLWLYFAYREKTRQLDEISHGGVLKLQSDKMVPFYDEKNKLKISVVQDDILYLESSDNYVMIYYISNNKISKYMIRNTLKNLESKLLSIGFIRCHRSYLVNFNKVKILKREKDGLFLELDSDPHLVLPVSKTYVSAIIESFSSGSD
jgi:DNA-binding LytR/AlgR family response regulator